MYLVPSHQPSQWTPVVSYCLFEDNLFGDKLVDCIWQIPAYYSLLLLTWQYNLTVRPCCLRLVGRKHLREDALRTLCSLKSLNLIQLLLVSSLIPSSTQAHHSSCTRPAFLVDRWLSHFYPSLELRIAMCLEQGPLINITSSLYCLMFPKIFLNCHPFFSFWWLLPCFTIMFMAVFPSLKACNHFWSTEFIPI